MTTWLCSITLPIETSGIDILVTWGLFYFIRHSIAHIVIIEFICSDLSFCCNCHILWCHSARHLSLKSCGHECFMLVLTQKRVVLILFMLYGHVHLINIYLTHVMDQSCLIH